MQAIPDRTGRGASPSPTAEGLGRVAVVVRLVGAVWIVLLLVSAVIAGQLERPVASGLVVAVAVAWAILAWQTGWIERAGRIGLPVVLADLAVVVGIIVAPGILGDGLSSAGGYPFGALVVALAGRGARGVLAAAGVLAVATSATLLMVGSASLTAATSDVLFYGLGAVALVLGERVLARQQERTRAAEAQLAVAREREATAAHLHDSVLQTLALVHRRADDPATVRSLVRRQERELRAWLFPDRRPGATRGEGRGLGAVLRAHAEDIRVDHDVDVRVVGVGGADRLPVPDGDRDGLAALAAAAREAMANAARHAGVDVVDVFVQAEDAGVRVFVRDRGRGFDRDGVPGDRQGVEVSIVGRMRRAGGTAEVRTAPGRGTEVELAMAVTPGGQDQQTGRHG